jgi:hypothetical protein
MAGFTASMINERVQTFWAALQRGEFITDAAAEAGTYRKKGARWMAAAGGVRPRRGRDLQGRYLSFAEREEIALSSARGESMRCIARRLGRSPATISPELRRNADRGPRSTSSSWTPRPATTRSCATRCSSCVVCTRPSAARSAPRWPWRCCRGRTRRGSPPPPASRPAWAPACWRLTAPAGPSSGSIAPGPRTAVRSLPKDRPAELAARTLAFPDAQSVEDLAALLTSAGER